MLTNAEPRSRQDNSVPGSWSHWTNPIPRQRGPATAGDPLTSATRHLSAAAYLDEQFRRKCLVEVYHQPRRLIAPSYGFDPVTVLHHCLRSRRITVIRDTLLVVIAFLVFLLAPIVFCLVAVLVLLSILAPRIVRWIRSKARKARAGTVSKLLAFIRRAALTAAIVLISLIAAISAALSAPGADDIVVQALAVSAILTASSVVPTILRQFTLARLGRSPRIGPEDPAGRRRLSQVADQSRGNVIVYSTHRPFVGAGHELEPGSSLTLRLYEKETDLLKGKPEDEREFATPPFRALDLIDHVRARLLSLAGESDPSSRLRGLTVDDRVFVAGSEVAVPVPEIDPSAVTAVIDDSTGPARHFLVCQVVAWDGELVTTLHLHIALQGRCLVVQLSCYGLAPCNSEYRVVDHRSNTGVRPYLSAVLRGIIQAPRTAAVAPYHLARELYDRASADLTTAIHRGNHRKYDYGAQLSIRELGSRDTTRNRFQTLDVYKYTQIMKSRALAAILDFLDARNVDTSEYRQRSTAILNQGVIFANNPNMTVDTLNNIQDSGNQPAGGTAQ